MKKNSKVPNICRKVCFYIFKIINNAFIKYSEVITEIFEWWKFYNMNFFD